MTTAYRTMWPVQRVLGAHLAHGETLHQSVLDRMAHASSKYAPKNIDTSIRDRLPVVTTTRIARGTPC